MILNRINTYLKNNSYNINLSNNTIYINNYLKIDTISETKLKIIFNNFTISIIGKDLKVLKMIDQEVLFNGTIEKIEYYYK